MAKRVKDEQLCGGDGFFEDELKLLVGGDKTRPTAARRRRGRQRGQAPFGVNGGEVKLLVSSRAETDLLVDAGDR